VDSRGLAREDPHPAAIFICSLPEGETQPKRINELTKENIVDSSGEAKAVRTQTMYARLMPGLYMLLAPTYIAGCTGFFDCIIQSNYKVEFSPTWPPKWMLKGERDIKEKDTLSKELQKMKMGEAGDDKKSNLMKKVKRTLVDIFGSGNDELEIPSDSDSDDDD
jgi:hypothetical protein